MNELFSDRINNVAPSFIREILKVASNSSMTSFAGGLPRRELFPIAALREATNKVYEDQGADALQYSNTEGFEPLREYIARRYWEKQGLPISMEDVLITSGAQQGLDLLGKVLINDGTEVIIEEPAYLGAIQALSLYRARLNTVPISTEGMVISKLVDVLGRCKPKLMYVVPNFQTLRESHIPKTTVRQSPPPCEIRQPFSLKMILMASFVSSARDSLLLGTSCQTKPYCSVRFPRRSFQLSG